MPNPLRIGLVATCNPLHNGPGATRKITAAGRLVFVFYLAVVLEKGDIHHRGFDPQDQPELVVHLDRHRPHGVLDARPLDARIEPVAHSSW